jgi:hypothetical protein
MQRLNDIINYLNPEQEHCKVWSKRISNFNKLILLSLVLWNLPSVIWWLNEHVKDKFRIILIHFCIWIILPLSISASSNIAKTIYDFLNKSYIFQLIVSIILITLVVFTYSKDLAWKL